MRCLALLHGAAVAGRFDAVEALVPLAEELGIPRTQIEAAGLQVVPYGGFPRAIETLGLISSGLSKRVSDRKPAEPKSRSSAEISTSGRETFERVYGDKAEAVLAQLESLHPGLAEHVLEAAYGRVLSATELPLGLREILAVAALALAALPTSLQSHIRGALRNGFTTAAVEDILHASSILADERALPVIQQALDQLSRKTPRP